MRFYDTNLFALRTKEPPEQLDFFEVLVRECNHYHFSVISNIAYMATATWSNLIRYVPALSRFWIFDGPTKLTTSSSVTPYNML